MSKSSLFYADLETDSAERVASLVIEAMETAETSTATLRKRNGRYRVEIAEATAEPPI